MAEAFQHRGIASALLAPVSGNEYILALALFLLATGAVVAGSWVMQRRIVADIARALERASPAALKRIAPVSLAELAALETAQFSSSAILEPVV